jgi:hypothetical protein
MEAKEIKRFEEGLTGFYGTEAYHKLTLTPLNCTDGVKYLAENGNCFWLIEAIASYRRKEPFQVWKLKVGDRQSAVLTMREDTDSPVLVEQKFDWTDFPLPEIKLWLIDGVLLLPSEY